MSESPGRFPTVPGDGLSETTVEKDGTDILIMYELTGEVGGDAWIACNSGSLTRDPDANRKV